MPRMNSQRLIPQTNRIRVPGITIPRRDLIVVRNRVIEIRNLLRNYNTLRTRDLDRQRIRGQNEYQGQIELILERRPREEQRGEYSRKRRSEKSKLGFLDQIRGFLDRLVLGIIGMKLLPMIRYLPAVVKGVGTVVDFASDFFIKMFNGFASFVEKGYEAHDFTRKQLKSFGGENMAKTFDGFMSAIENVFTGAIVAAFAFSDLAKGDQRGGWGEAGPRRGFDIQGRRVGTRAQERYLQRYGERQFAERFGERALTRITTRGAEQTVKRGVLSGIVKRVPIVGGLLDFALNYFVFKESLGESAFRAAGSTLFGFLGGLLGSFPALVPFGGPFIGAVLGGWAGDALSSMLFDALFKNKTPSAPQAAKHAGGGPTPSTRGGRLVSKPIRKRPTKKYKRQLQAKATQLKPGASVGGVEKIKKLFPEPDAKDKGKTVNSLGYHQSSYKNLSSANNFGGLFALALKAQLGERPTDLDYQIAASGITSWMQATFSNQILRSGGAFAGGGEVDSNMFMSGALSDMKNVVAKSIQNSVAPKINDSIEDLMRQLGLKEMEGKEKPTQKPSQEGGGEGEGIGDDSPAGIVFNALLQEGFTANQAAGVIGNLMQESGGGTKNLDPKAKNDIGNGHYGIAQWDMRDRWPAVASYIKSIGKDPDTVDGQAAGLIWELKNREKRAYNNLKKAGSPEDAAAVWVRDFERSGETAGMAGYDNRLKYAATIAKEFAAGGMQGQTPIDEYITGDPNTPFGKFDKGGHGESHNYHDHLGFKDRSTALRAYNFFKSKGFQVTQFQGYGRVGGHAEGSLHYSGLAFDIPGSQWGGSGAIGPTEYRGSAKVRATLKEFLGTAKFAKGGRVRKPTTALIGEKGPEFIFDADTTKGLDSLAPGLLEKLNIARTKPQIASILHSYADYEEYADKTVYVMTQGSQMIPVPYAVSSPQRGSFGGSGGSSHRDILFSGT